MTTEAAKPIKVLHLTSGRGFYGIDRVIMTLARYIDRQAFETRIVNLGKNRTPDSSIVSFADAAGIDATILLCRKRFDWATVKELKDLIQRDGIDLLHCHESKSRLYGVTVSKLTGVPVIGTQHGMSPHNLTSRIANIVDIGCLRFCRKVVTVARPDSKAMACAFIPSSLIECIVNGIDVAAFTAPKKDATVKQSLGIPAMMPVIGAVGRLESDKGCELLIGAAKIITETGQNAAYLIVGDGSERPNLQSMARRLGISDRIFFAGFREDVRPFVSIMDIFALPSRTEGTPMALLEAMIMGKPVVATQVGGVPDIISTGVNGIVLRERNARQLAEALLALLADDTLASRLAEQGRKRVESEYSATQMARRYEAVYRECASHRSGSQDPEGHFTTSSRTAFRSQH